VEQPTVLIISDDAEFSRAIASRWQMERNVPAFTLMGSDLYPGIGGESFELAIVGAVRPKALGAVLSTLESTGKPVILVASDTLQALANETYTRVMVLRDYEGWREALVLVCSEALRRAAALERAQCAEQDNRSLKTGATLGRYALDMRHTVNNALTSILGNSELLLAEPGTFSAATRAQIETIRNMASRIHEVLQRFSSLEKELRFLEKQPEEAAARSQAAGAVF